MSTTNTTTSTKQFDPSGMGTYQQFQPAFRNALLQDVGDPRKSMFFNTQLAMASRGNQAGNQAANQNILLNSRQLGYGGNQAIMGSQLARQSRAFQGNQAQSMNNLLLQAAQRRQSALGMMGGFQPLQTGSTQTQKQSGLGTWLPQVAGMGLSALTMGMGGIPGMGGGGGGGSQPYWSQGPAPASSNTLLPWQ